MKSLYSKYLKKFQDLQKQKQENAKKAQQSYQAAQKIIDQERKKINKKLEQEKVVINKKIQNLGIKKTNPIELWCDIRDKLLVNSISKVFFKMNVHLKTISRLFGQVNQNYKITENINQKLQINQRLNGIKQMPHVKVLQKNININKINSQKYFKFFANPKIYKVVIAFIIVSFVGSSIAKLINEKQKLESESQQDQLIRQPSFIKNENQY